MGVSPNRAEDSPPLASRYCFIGHITVAAAATVQRGAGTDLSVMEGKGFVALMQAVPLFCPGPVLAGCKTWMVAGLGL